MLNNFLAERSVRDIDSQIAKILRDLGNPKPPVRLEVVRELLKLDLTYYKMTDQGLLSETVHRLKVAGKQVYYRPAFLLDALRKWSVKALLIPDQNRILISTELPPKKVRWAESHEIIHRITPWHDVVMHGDNDQTLSSSCELEIEAEANYGAGRLLFFQDIFDEQLKGEYLTLDFVRKLSVIFGNTITSTLWRAVEGSETEVFGLVSQHPRQPLRPEPIRYMIRSRKFLARFGEVGPSQIYRNLHQMCRSGRGPLGKSEIVLFDGNGAQHVFLVECFFNGYEALTLGVYQHIKVPTTLFQTVRTVS